MNKKLRPSTRIPYSLLFGTAFLIIGLIIDDVYSVIVGSSLLIIATISATGEKIMQKIDHEPKGL